MTDYSASRPAVVVDLKKDRIRIHKNTIHAIGAPDYILLLVNPETRTLAIVRSNRYHPRAFPLSTASSSNNTLELYSRSLVKSLSALCMDWRKYQSYRLYGEIILNRGIARFYMSEAVPVNGGE